jgi:hypothetical protein
MRRKRLKKRKIFFYECVLEFNYATIKGLHNQVVKIVVPYWVYFMRTMCGLGNRRLAKFLRVAYHYLHRLYAVQVWDTSFRDASPQVTNYSRDSSSQEKPSGTSVTHRHGIVYTCSCPQSRQSAKLFLLSSELGLPTKYLHM